MPITLEPANPPDEIARVLGTFKKLFGSERIAWEPLIESFAEQYPADWVVYAVEKCAGFSDPIRTVTPIRTELQRMQVAGGIPKVNGHAAPKQRDYGKYAPSQELRDAYKRGAKGFK